MNIIGINGSFRVQSGFVFPTHPDFKLLSFDKVKNMNINDIDAFVQSNVLGKFKNRYKEHHDFMKSTGKPRIVFEQATFRKNLDFTDSNNYYYKVGLNHFTYDEGDFKNQNSPSDRWDIISKEQKIVIKPWQNKTYNNSQYILFLLQNPLDTSLNTLDEDYNEWIIKVCQNITERTKKNIKIRLHPRFINRYNTYAFSQLPFVSISENMQGANVSNGGDGLYEDFKNAWAVVTYSSNSATEAVCEGIPTINLHKSSFSWPVSYHSLDILKEKQINCSFDRTQWLYDCAYTQWTLKEINSGIVHRRLLNG